jgi:hypothetical protein
MSHHAPSRRRGARTYLVGALVFGGLVLSGCGSDEADRAEISRDLGQAYAAYMTYVAEPAKNGQLGPSTAKSSPISQQATTAARFAISALEAARTEAVRDAELASFAQKTAAAGASLNAIAEVLRTGRPSRGLVNGGVASLESLMAAARDRGLSVDPQQVSAADLNEPPTP